MNVALNKISLLQAHSTPPVGMVFYNSLDSILNDTNLLGYVSVMKRAWLTMKLDGILCLDNRPVLYLKEYARPFTSGERIFWHKLFWNQGVANILILADPSAVYIYSGLAKPQVDVSSDNEKETVLVETISRSDYISRIQPFHHELATGHYYEKENHSKFFDPDNSVDTCLLNNLQALRDSLIKGNDKLDIMDAHAFIGRILFLCYLLDREVISIEKSEQGVTGTMMLAKILGKKSYNERLIFLYDFFYNLKNQFNGNMFDQDLQTEKDLIKPTHLEKLMLFLGGHEVKSGQHSFGFWPYDFKMIPVETISAIYQDFLATEDKEKQRKRGAFYTPRFLAEMVVDTALAEEYNMLNGSFFDPACGSGIFLVILFNRIANKWIQEQTSRINYVTKAKALRKILADQIRGVDLELTACRIACFSLYLAFLDFFDPPDIQEYIEKTGHPLPKILDYGDSQNHPPADIPVIYKADFLSHNSLGDKTFDCIIGNPPWEGRQSKQLAQKFLDKAPLFLRNGGTGCLLLPTKIFQNQTDAFQSEWLQKVTLEKVLQLADYSFLLFNNALCPAIIARFKNSKPNLNRHRIEFIAPKFNRDGLREGNIIVNPSARTWIPLADIISATTSKTAPIVWKSRLWGTPRDQKFLDLLQTLPKLSDLAGEPKENKRWIKGEGFQPYYPERAKEDPNYPNPKQNPYGLGSLFIEADPRLQMFVFQNDCMTLAERLKKLNASQEFLRRTAHKKYFQAPMVLVSHGFSKVAYCDFNVLFQHSLQSISGPEKDSSLLIFLTAYLKSKLARYFLFHTSASWGSERDAINLNELLRVPFPLPGNDFISKDADKIIMQISKKILKLREELQNVLIEMKNSAKGRLISNDKAENIVLKERHEKRKNRITILQDEIDPLIYSYFNLTDQEIFLIEDTNKVFIPSSTPSSWRSTKIVTLDPVEETTVEPYLNNGLKLYAETLTKTLNIWACREGSKYRVRAEGGTDKETGLALLSLILNGEEAAYQEKVISQDLFAVLKKYHSNISKRNNSIHYERNIFIFQGEQIHIVRPYYLVNWTRTAALNDAATIYGEVAFPQTGFR